MKGHILSGLCGFSVGCLTLWLTFRWHQQQEKRRKSKSPATITNDAELSHWNALDDA